MKTTGRGRVVWLGGALLATLLATQWVSGGDGGVDTVSAGPDQKAKREMQGEIKGEMKGEMKEMRAAEDDTAQLELERLERRKFSAQAGDLFSRQSWIPPPPPAKSQPPSPPPLMFKYLGKVTEGDETQVFLALAERNYVVKVGEKIDNQYRVDEVTDHAITLTYIPLNAKQVLSTGGGV
jgi:Tfp pilus assembly protein PilP